ncbi:MAG: hypothetical protein J3Q66DRAFT_126704 [Benniella sp.]|nr:MAG: hypothetical protein J3Q66DRAFT_126704 [Benniella sp.]
MNYIQPLLSSDPKVLVYVLIALSCFTATENLHILETGLPSQYIRERILVSSDTLVVNEYSLVIGKLVRHELQHMRRGLYKDAAFKKATPEAQTGPQELDRLQGLLRLCQAMSSINGSLEMSIQVCESDTLFPVYCVPLSEARSHPTQPRPRQKGERKAIDLQRQSESDRVIGT